MFKLSGLIAYAFGAACVAVTSGSVVAQDYPELNFRHASGWPQALYTTKPGDYFAEKVHERSGGKITIKNFYGGSLGKSNEVLDLVSKGAIEIGTVVPGFYTSALPFAAMSNSLPMAFPDGAAAMHAAMKLEQTNPDSMAEIERNNLVPLVHHFLPNYKLICTSAIRTMADLKGKKVRSFGNYQPTLFNALGITPVNMLPADSYEALKRGSMDCFYATNATFVAFKLHEVAKYIINIDFGAINAFWIAMNRDKFLALPANVQELLKKTGDEASEYCITITEEAESNALKTMTAGGAQVVKFEDQAAVNAAAPDMFAVWIENMAKDGKEKEARAYVEQMKALLAAK